MKKLSLTLLLLFFRILGAWSQEAVPNAPVPDSSYASRKLKLDEVSLVSGYYHQDGNNSAVTGGIGTESLTDFANTIDLKLVRQDAKGRQHNFTLEVGIDHYTSASSDKIDPATVSSASSADTRIYPSLAWSMKNDRNKWTLGAGLYYSTEYDYKSFGLGVNAAKSSKDNNRELSVKLLAYWDTWKVILPIELRPGGPIKEDEGASPRNSYSASFALSQVINKRLQGALLFDVITQQGLLATKYQRVYFTDASERSEALPDNRLKLAFGVRGALFLGDRVILRPFYRYYTDDWGLKAHTVNLELPVKINPYFSVSPFYRFYTQTAADYFAPFAAHLAVEPYYTSDYDLSDFSSQYFGAGIRYSPEKGVLGIRHWSLVELRYGHYNRSNGLHSDIMTLMARFK